MFKMRSNNRIAHGTQQWLNIPVFTNPRLPRTVIRGQNVRNVVENDGFTMIDLLVRVFYILAVLAVISLFVCTIPIWLVVLVVVLLWR